MRLLLLAAARVWVSLGDVAALAFTAGVTALFGSFVVDSLLPFNLTQVDISIPRYVLPTAVAAGVACLIHCWWPKRDERLLYDKQQDSTGNRQPDDAGTARVTKIRGRDHPGLDRMRNGHANVPSQQDQPPHRQQIDQPTGDDRGHLQLLALAGASLPDEMPLSAPDPAWRLLINSGFDVLYNVATPLGILYPYWRDFQGGLINYPTGFYYTDTWYVAAVSELRQLLVTSWFDFVCKVSGWLALILRFVQLKLALDRVRRRIDPSITPVRLPPTVHTLATRDRSLATQILDSLLILWGFVLLCLHLHTSITSAVYYDPACVLEVSPWGSTGHNCAVVEIDCWALNTHGEKATMQSALSRIDPLSVQSLTFAHCAELEVPPCITTYQNLLMLKFYNATIANWGVDAALREIHHPSLKTLLFPRVHMTHIPDGLLSNDFPRSVFDIEFCKSNINTFPSIIEEIWRGVGLVVLEGNPDLVELPRSLARLPYLQTIIMTLDGIQSVPDDLFAGRAIAGVDLGSNPLENLPSTLGSLTELLIIGIQGTHIREIPASWTTLEGPPYPATLVATGTPLCDSRASAPNRGPRWLVVDCDSPVPPDLYFYPIEAEDQWHTISTK